MNNRQKWETPKVTLLGLFAEDAVLKSSGDGSWEGGEIELPPVNLSADDGEWDGGPVPMPGITL